MYLLVWQENLSNLYYIHFSNSVNKHICSSSDLCLCQPYSQYLTHGPQFIKKLNPSSDLISFRKHLYAHDVFRET